MVWIDACNQGLGRVLNHAIGQAKVSWKHPDPNEATWELEDAMRLAHPFWFNFVKH